MNNETFLNQAKNYYPSLRDLQITDNYLIYAGNKTPLYYTYLANLNPNIFLLEAQDIFEIIRLMELLYKVNLDDDDILFITKYTKRYLQLNEGHVQNNDGDENLIWCLSMPIYTSYDENFKNTPTSMLIEDIINTYTFQSNDGTSRGPKLVLTNNKIFQLENETDNLKEFEKAGFSVILLIAGTVVLTTIYIAFFIINH